MHRSKVAGLLPPNEYIEQVTLVKDLAAAVSTIDFEGLTKTLAFVMENRPDVAEHAESLTAIVAAAAQFQAQCAEAEFRFCQVEGEIH